MSDSGKKYISYLVRLWRATGDDDDIWRASVESAQTGEKEAFPNLEALFKYLREKAGVRFPPQGAPTQGAPTQGVPTNGPPAKEPPTP